MARNLKNAYTIIEMVMVIIIIGILAALAVPRFNSFYSIKLNGAAKKLVSDIRFTQQIAISEHTYTRIVFDIAAETYTAYKYDTGTSSWVNMPDPFTRGNLIENFNSDPKYGGINISSTTFSANTSTFDWQGIPGEGNGYPPSAITAQESITLTYKGNTVSVFITPQTGRVTM